MAARVDAAAGLVVDGDQTWALRLDCRTGGAAVTIGDRVLELGPLCWRSKQRLARWAHLGPSTVDRLLADLSVDADVILGDDDVAVVAAVAAFLDGGLELPLDPVLLAGVTVDLCRSAGLAPQALDERDAAEIAALWRAVRGRPLAAIGPDPAAPAERAEDPWADATTIRFGERDAAPDMPEVAGAPPADAPEQRREAVAPAPSPRVETQALEGSAAPDAGASRGQRRARRELVRFRVTPSVEHHPWVDRGVDGPGVEGGWPAPPDSAPRPASSTTAVADHAAGSGPAGEVSGATPADGVRPPARAVPAVASSAHPLVADGTETASPGPTPREVRPVPNPPAPPPRGSASAPGALAPLRSPAEAGHLWLAPVPANEPAHSLDGLVAASLERLAAELGAAAEDLGIEV